MVRLGKCKARCKCNMRLQEQRSDKSERVEEKKNFMPQIYKKETSRGKKEALIRAHSKDKKWRQHAWRPHI